MQPATDVSARTSTLTENHNHNKIRRRNVPESAKGDNVIDSCDRVPLVILPDSTKAWYNSVAPQIPNDIVVATSNKQQNGVLTHEDDLRDSNDDSGATDVITSREKMKISVIRGSIAKPDLTLGELRLLGCSSEGFVNGTLPR